MARKRVLIAHWQYVCVASICGFAAHSSTRAQDIDADVSPVRTCALRCAEPAEDRFQTCREEGLDEEECLRRWSAEIRECTATCRDEFCPCGNDSALTVLDTHPPKIECPPNTRVEWGDPLGPGHLGRPIVEDDCDDDPIVVHVDVRRRGECPVVFVLHRIWIAIDKCGNASRCVQRIAVVDTTPPTIECPPAIRVECGDPTTPDATGEPIVEDNCDDDPFVVHFDFPRKGDCPIVSRIDRLWAAIDECGNFSFCWQGIAVVDTTPPQIECPPDVRVEWGKPLDPAHTGRPRVRDNCVNAPVVRHVDTRRPGDCPAVFFIDRVWIATDACGNSSRCRQTITVVDTTPPEIECPQNVRVEWGKPLDPAHTGEPRVKDECDPNPRVRHVDSRRPGNCPVVFWIDRLWVAVDACGNVSRCLQTIAVVDTTPPRIECPPDVRVRQGDPIDPSHTGEPIVEDECDENPVVEFHDLRRPGDGRAFVIDRTWIATDACGNVNRCVQTIRVLPNPTAIDAAGNPRSLSTND